jgi:hypothetical protein
VTITHVSPPSHVARRELTLQELLVIENDAAILEFRCPRTDLLLWPLIRVVVLRMIMSDLLYGTSLDGIGDAKPVSIAAWYAMLRAVLHNRRRWPAADVCIVSTAVANQLVGGRWYNRLADPFALQYPATTVTIEEPFEWRWQMPRHHGNVLFFAPRLAAGAIVGRVRVSTAARVTAAGLIDFVLARARDNLAWACDPVRRGQLVEMLARKLASLPTQFAGYGSMLDAIRPKLLMVTGACYGPLSPLVVAANRRGVVTAEYQHGAVSSGHDAYNFAPVVAASTSYRETLPAFFLGYGSWWNEQFNAPVTKRVIGNPHRDRQLQQIRRDAADRTRILILSDGIEFALYVSHARSIAAAVGNRYQIVLRPHPLERSIVRATYGLAIDDVVIDQEQDLYTSLARAHAVISEVSTGLFEAVGIAEKVFVWDTPKARFGFPTHPFQRFATVAELAELLRDTHSGQLAADAVDAIWASGWQAHYAAFLESAGLHLVRAAGNSGAPGL